VGSGPNAYAAGCDAPGAACLMPNPENAGASVSELNALAATYPTGIGLYDYILDEPRLQSACMSAQVLKWARNLHQTTRPIRMLITDKPSRWFRDDTAPHSDIWVMPPQLFDTTDVVFVGRSAWDTIRTVMRKTPPDSIWSYYGGADGHSPSEMIDYAPINCRVQPGIISQSLGLTGLLSWHVCLWEAVAPWDNVDQMFKWNGSVGNHYPGSGLYVYPGAYVGMPGKVAPSMRLKWMRDGVDDFDYLQLLKDQGQLALVDSLLTVLAPRTVNIEQPWKDWTRSPAQLENCRIVMGNRLSTLGLP
jgi:hypothetical protein